MQQKTTPIIKCHLHPQENVQGVCFKMPCQHPSRLVCFICVVTHHNDHGNDIIELEDIYDFRTDSQQNVWPNDDKGKEIKQAIQYLESVENADFINELFTKILQSLDGELQKSKVSLEQQYSKQRENILKNCTQLRQKFLNSFGMTDLKEKIIALNSKSETFEKFEEFLIQYVAKLFSVESQEIRNQISSQMENDLKSEIILFKQKQFQKENDKVIDLINDLKQCFTYLRMNLGVEFVLQKAIQFNGQDMIELEKGFRYQMKQKAAVISSKQLFEGKYVITLQIFTLTQQSCVVIGLVEESQKTLSNLWDGDHVTALCISCIHMDCKQFTKNSGNTLGSAYPKGDYKLVITIDVQNDLFQISDSARKNIFSSNRVLKNKGWRLYVYKYKSENLFDFQLLESRWKL